MVFLGFPAVAGRLYAIFFGGSLVNVDVWGVSPKATLPNQHAAKNKPQKGCRYYLEARMRTYFKNNHKRVEINL